MDFMQRGGQTRSNGATRSAASNGSGNGGGVIDPGDDNNHGGNHGSNKRNILPKRGGTPWQRISFLVLLFAGTILALGAIWFLALGKGTYAESKLVQKGDNDYQAVFINVNGTNGGQVYFGKVTDLTRQYIRLEKVFYIQNQQSGQDQQNNSSYNLVKLGCELHGPQDQMVINRDEVFFWENLKADSQVVQKIEEFNKQNPDGQKCGTGNQQGAQQTGGTGAGTGTGNSTAPSESNSGTTQNSGNTQNATNKPQ